MKKRIILLFIMVCIFALVGCTPKKEETESKSLVGYIIIEDDLLYLDEVEIIMKEDVEKIAKLGLNQQEHFPSGYYIYNPDMGKDRYDLTDETIYTFTDSNLLFIGDEEGDRSYTTTKKEEIVQHLSATYSDTPPAQKVPFFIEVKDDKVISITEKFEFTV